MKPGMAPPEATVAPSLFGTKDFFPIMAEIRISNVAVAVLLQIEANNGFTH